MKKIKKILAIALIAVLAFAFIACGNTDKGESTLPKKGDTITITCGYGVGGTADAIARKFAQVAGEVYPDYTFIVENVTGGDGFAAFSNFTKKDPSTHDLLIYGYGVAYRHDLGKEYDTEIVNFDREEVWPVVSVDDRTYIVYTRPDSSLEDVLSKGEVKMSGGNPLSDPHLAFGSLMSLEDVSVQVIPYDGGAEQLKALTDGEVDVFVGTTQAGMEYVEAGTVIPVLAISEEKYDNFVGPDGKLSVYGLVGEAQHPALQDDLDYTGSILPAGGFIATRKGADQEWIDKVAEIGKSVWEEPDYHEWIEEIGLNRFEVYDEDANLHLEEACGKALISFDLLNK